MRKRLRVIFERGLKKGGTMPYRGKKRVERRRFRAETRQPFEPVTVHRTERSDRGLDGSMLFLHGTVLHLKWTMKVNGSRISRSDHTVRSGFNNLGSGIRLVTSFLFLFVPFYLDWLLTLYC